MDHIRIYIRDQHGNVLDINRIIDNIGNWDIVVNVPDRAAELLRAPAEPEQDAIDDIDQRIVDAELKMFPWGKNDAS